MQDGRICFARTARSSPTAGECDEAASISGGCARDSPIARWTRRPATWRRCLCRRGPVTRTSALDRQRLERDCRRLSCREGVAQLWPRLCSLSRDDTRRRCERLPSPAGAGPNRGVTAVRWTDRVDLAAARRPDPRLRRRSEPNARISCNRFRSTSQPPPLGVGSRAVGFITFQQWRGFTRHPPRRCDRSRDLAAATDAIPVLTEVCPRAFQASRAGGSLRRGDGRDRAGQDLGVARAGATAARTGTRTSSTAASRSSRTTTTSISGIPTGDPPF